FEPIQFFVFIITGMGQNYRHIIVTIFASVF
ncbi:hypothetical protein VCHENC02_5272, partial [Vibrio harveyi]